jgi:hypothetical protein
MKRIILILFLNFFSLLVYGQTYTIVVKYRASSSGCHAASYDWVLSGNSTSIASFSDGGNSMNINTSNTYATVPNYSTFNLSIGSGCIPLGAATLDCNDNFNTTRTAIQLIQGSTINLASCNGNVSINSFKPNLTILKSNPSTSEVCSGEMLDLSGFPAGFPSEAYHWQYSLDNQVTWIDVPAGFNNNPNSNFSMQDILGINHSDYWNKVIYFRLGYSSRAFCAPYAVTYSPCAPIVKKITYNGPKCSGDNIQDVTITFNRDLYTNEYLSPLSIVKQNDASFIAKQTLTPITSFDGADPLNKTFSFTNFTGLDDGITYTIKYQAFQGTTARGVVTTPKIFTYNEIMPLKFTTTAIQPVCSYDTGGIAITAMGGTPPYFYILDSGAPIEFTSPYNLTRLSTVDHTIKVIDKNLCTEQ